MSVITNYMTIHSAATCHGITFSSCKLNRATMITSHSLCNATAETSETGVHVHCAVNVKIN